MNLTIFVKLNVYLDQIMRKSLPNVFIFLKMDQNEEVIQQQPSNELEENEGTEDEVEEGRESSEHGSDESEEGDDYEDSTTKEESVEEYEPKLKYKRLEADVSELL